MMMVLPFWDWLSALSRALCPASTMGTRPKLHARARGQPALPGSAAARRSKRLCEAW